MPWGQLGRPHRPAGSRLLGGEGQEGGSAGERPSGAHDSMTETGKFLSELPEVWRRTPGSQPRGLKKEDVPRREGPREESAETVQNSFLLLFEKRDLEKVIRPDT